MSGLKATLALSLLALALGLVACGGGSSSTSTTSAQQIERFRIPQTMPPVRRQKTLTSDGSQLMGPELKPVIPGQPAPRTLVLQDLIQGLGYVAEPGDRVAIQYVAYVYETGEKLASSWDQGKPSIVTLGSGKLPEGVEEGLIEMEVGDRREMIVPPAMAHGSDAVKGLPPHSHLVFVVDLLAIK